MKSIKLINEKSARAAMHVINANLGSNKIMQIVSEDTLRNEEQNKLFHAIRDQMSEQSNHVGDGKYIPPAVMKDWIVFSFDNRVVVLPDGTQINKRVDTRNMSRKAFSDLVRHTLSMALDLGMTIEFKNDKHKAYMNGDGEWWQ
jgi:hypothetical protein